MVPSSVAKMKIAAPDLPFAETTNDEVPLKMRPVGLALVPPAGGGIVTTRGEPTGKDVPSPRYKVESPVPLSAIQNGDVGPKAKPHGLTRLGSTNRATPAISETRFIRVYIGWFSIPCGTATIPDINATITRKTKRIFFIDFLHN